MEAPHLEYRPDYDREPPGDMLKWFLDSRGLKIVDFAKRCGRPTKTISEIVAGKTAITPETALQFERVLGVEAATWLQLEAGYRLEKARDEEKSLAMNDEALSWAKCFPIAEMARYGFLAERPKKTALVDTLLRFFGVSSVAAWTQYWDARLNLAFFKKQKSGRNNSYGVAAWMRQGERLATQAVDDWAEPTPYSEAVFRSVLPKIRGLTREPWDDIQDQLVQQCAAAGVIVVFVPFLSKTDVRGAAFWARKDRPVIILSDRGKSEALIWFAFFHEAAHILLHSKKTVFLDQGDAGTSEASIENEADRFSAETLIPGDDIDRFVQIYGSDVGHIAVGKLAEFAAEIDIDPGLLMRRLQWEEVLPQKYRSFNRLNRKIQFSN